ncbi:hypothetical protein ACLOJK_031407 [Asimina triloba]
MNYTHITDNLIVGSQPQKPEDIDNLKQEENVAYILNLQQDKDIEYWGIDFESIVKRCKEVGIRHMRRPARDFDPDSLRNGLPKAVSSLEWAISEGNGGVYVHCTAGLGRAPAVAIAYLFWFHDMDVSSSLKSLSSLEDIGWRVEVHVPGQLLIIGLFCFLVYNPAKKLVVSLFFLEAKETNVNAYYQWPATRWLREGFSGLQLGFRYMVRLVSYRECISSGDVNSSNKGFNVNLLTRFKRDKRGDVVHTGCMIVIGNSKSHQMSFKPYNTLTSKRPCGPNKRAIRGATYDLAKNDPWKEPFEGLPEHAFANVADWERKLIQDRVRSLRGT